MFQTRLPALTLLVALTALTACTREITYRQGATTTQISQAEDACALAALNQAPVRNRTDIIPGAWVPPVKVCDAAGNCAIRPGYREAPEFVTVDVNEKRRGLLQRQCLAAKGFDRVTLPFCKAAQKEGQPALITRTLPALTEQSCIVPRGSAYQIIP